MKEMKRNAKKTVIKKRICSIWWM